MSLEAVVADLTNAIKRNTAALEAMQNVSPKIQNLDVSGQLESEESVVADEPAVETVEAVEQDPKPKKAKKGAAKKASKPAEEVEDDEPEEEKPSGKITAKDISPLLHKLTGHYAENQFDGDKAKGKSAVLDFMAEQTGVRRLDQMSQDQLGAFKGALEEELA